METKKLGIRLNHLTFAEYCCHKDTFEEYKEAVLFALQVQDMFIYEDVLIEAKKDDLQIRRDISEGMSPMDAIRQHSPDRYYGAGHRKKDGQEGFTPIWFDIWNEHYIITPEYPLFDKFFAYKLRQTDILELDNLLDSFLKNHEGDTTEFIRFLRLTLRKHGKKLIQPEQTETIEEWIAGKEKETELSGAQHAIKTKGKPKRTHNDDRTCLNQEQTALFIACLRKTQFIYPKEFLTNNEAGQATAILTGYSADAIRQNLNEDEIRRIAAIPKNVSELMKAVEKLRKYILTDIMP